MSANHVPGEAYEWFTTALGAYVLEREQAYFDGAVADIFGYNAFQLGLPEVDLLRASRIASRWRVDPGAGADLRADFRDLPIASNSADLVLLPHVLEYNEHPHQILRDVARALRPEAHLVISCFNPWSLWGARRLLASSPRFPWRGRFISLVRLKDWLALLGLEIVGGRMSCYVPPCSSRKWLERLRFMEQAGDRWWPISGGVFFLDAVKRVQGLRIIMPRWSDRLVPSKGLAGAPKKVARREEALAARTRTGSAR
jgi:SAM-dependent methyltransferase